MDAFEKRQLEKRLREEEHFFEFCIVPDYETVYVGERLHTFPVEEVSIQCFLQDDELQLVSLIFDKMSYEKESLLQWLSEHGIHIGAVGKSALVHHARSVEYSYMFFDHVVVQYTKGDQTISVDREHAEEWTDYERPLLERLLDTDGRRVPIPMVVINDELLPGCPTLKFNRKIDTVIVGGTIMNIDRIDEYGDGIGFYRKNIREPVAFMENERVAILINLFVDTEDDGKVCTVTYMPMGE
ncbi:hypothetical protein [Exiguobacterium oxidotolerans]|uniref:hypothetical protein n=1 Tax=Exiguobacterium oxidotolerans TaxID=223958 RepID=UPI000494054F|nr:hypothetical protein [Exiguobacterium oxidotolerans]